MREALASYIEATYHLSHPKVVELRRQLLLEGGVAQTPYIESTPAYLGDRCFADLALPDDVGAFLTSLAAKEEALLFDPPYEHQADALEATMRDDAAGSGIVVTTGTGSGKTESFLLPVLALFAMASTIGSRERELRLAALRLVGMSVGQTRLVAALESAVISTAGLLGGWGIFLVGRAWLAPRIPLAGGVFSADVTPPVPAAVAVTLGLPVAAVGAAWLALRRVQITPLGVSQRGQPRPPRPRRIVPLVAGACCLLLAALVRPGAGGVNRSGIVLVLAAVLIIVGLAVGAPVVARLVAGLVYRLSGGVLGTLVARRVQVDPATTSRVVTGSALLVYVSGFLLAFFPLLAYSNAPGDRALVGAVGADTFLAQLDGPRAWETVEALRQDPHVHAVAMLRPVSLASPTDVLAPTAATAASCEQLRAVVTVRWPRCVTGAVYQSGPDSEPSRAGQALSHARRLVAVTQTTRADGTIGSTVLGPVAPTRPAVTVPAIADLTPVVNSGILIDETVLPPGAFADGGGTLLVAHDGQDGEAVRTRIIATTGATSVLTAGEVLADHERTSQMYQQLTLVALLVAGFVAALSLVVTLAEQVREQRQALVSLWQAGVSIRTLRWAVLWQTVIVIVPVTLVALLLAIASSAVFLALDDASPAVPWSALLTLGAGAVVLPLVTTALTMPALHAATRTRLPDAEPLPASA
jgi:hypothetical protein